MEITREIAELIELVAEAKTELLLVAASRGAPDYETRFDRFKLLTMSARAAFDTFLQRYNDRGPLDLYVQLRACELGVERLRPQKPPLTPQ